MSHARDSHFLHYVITSLKPKSCALLNFDTLRHILIMFGRNKEVDW